MDNLKPKPKYDLLFILFVFACIYSSISLVNHYLFRTCALDLGMFNHAIYDFSHFRNNKETLISSNSNVNYLADHFSVITILLSPLYYIFGSWTLLIVQIVSILIGGYGIYLYSIRKSENHWISLLIMIQFFGIWGIYAALSFDFHANVIAAMIVPWFIYFYDRWDKKYIVLTFILIIICKENMALWMFFILMGLQVKDNFKTLKKEPVFILSLLLFSLAYFIFLISFFMPYINDAVETSHLWRYRLLGNNLKEIFITIILHPLYTISLFFNNPHNIEFYDGIKSELHFMVFVSGGIALIFRPWYLIMLLPIYAQKMFSDNPVIWGINGQYSIEFVPILSLALFDAINELIKGNQIKISLLVIMVISTFHFTFKSIENRKSIWYDPIANAFFIKAHYQNTFNISEAHDALKLIPEDASVSAHDKLVPHIACRKKIYLFPFINDADYIALFKEGQGTYPASKEEYENRISELITSGKYIVIYDKNTVLILKRNH